MKPLFFTVISLGFINSAFASLSKPCLDRVVYSALQEATIHKHSPHIPFKGCKFSALKQSGAVFDVILQCMRGAGFENPTISLNVQILDTYYCSKISAVLVDWPQHAY